MKIVAIGGGEIGRPGTEIETESIDKEIIKLTNKPNPLLLFLPTASGDSESYYDVVKGYFSGLGCQTDVLYLTKNPSDEEIRDAILAADIIYVGGGNTKKMMKLWKERCVDHLLKDALKDDIVLSGLSAGSICWFKDGLSDSLIMEGKDEWCDVEGLNFIPFTNCPHYATEKRAQPFKELLRNGSIGIALDECAALVKENNQYKIISSKPEANAYKCYWKDNQYHEEVLEKDKLLSLE